MASPMKKQCLEMITFSVTVSILNKDGTSKPIIKNAVRSFRTDDTWFDVFDTVTQNEELPKNLENEVETNLEKIAVVKVSSSATSGEMFDANPYDRISVLTSFHKSLKYVTISIKNVKNGGETKTNTSENARSMMMAQASTRRIALDKPRFSVAQRETQAYQEHRQQNTQTSFNYVGTAGGGRMRQAEARRKQIQETQKLLKKEENKSYFKQWEEEKMQKKKEEQRKKAIQNERRKKEEEETAAHKWNNQRKVANEAFLRRFENKSKRLAGAKPSTSTQPTQSTSSAESSERLQPAGAMGCSALVAMETHHYAEPEEELTSTETQIVSQLAAIFPQYSETELLQILKQVDFSLNTAVAILKD